MATAVLASMLVATAVADASPPAMAEPTDDNPAVWSVAIDPGGPAKPGQTVSLTVSLRLAPGWHAYGDVPKGSPYAPTVIDARLPQGLTFDGEWTYPPLKPYDEGTSIIDSDGKFTRKVKIAPGVKGQISIPVAISWQTCDLSRCLPPDKKTFNVDIHVL